MDNINIGDILVLKKDDRFISGIVRSKTYIKNQLSSIYLNDETNPWHTWELEESLHKIINRSEYISINS